MTPRVTVLEFLDRFPGQWVDQAQIIRDTGLSASETSFALRELAADGLARVNRKVSPPTFKLVD